MAMYVSSERRLSLSGRPKKSSTDVDEAVVERLIAGDRELRPTWFELDAAILALMASGRNTRTAAERLGISSDTIYRHASRRRVLMEG